MEVEPLEVVHPPNSGDDPELGPENYLSRRPDLDPDDSDSNIGADIHSELQKLELKEEEDGEIGKDSDEGKVVNVPEKIEESGEDGDIQNGRDYLNEDENSGGLDGGGKWEVEKKDESSEGSFKYPQRPGAEDCSFYLKTGACKFGPYCKFNHPVWRNYQDRNPRSTECKYYLTMGGCKFGKACKFNHTRTKGSDGSVPELNFLGLPVRQGEKECPYYMRTGSCKYGASCKFNHPDPTASVESNHQCLGDERLLSPYGPPEPAIMSCSSSRTGNESVPFVPMVQMQGKEFPERPGRPDCNYFIRTGDCKYKYTCKYHHPKSRNLKSPPCILNHNGLPLRPGENVCMIFGQYGICKFGPACKYDHPTGLEYSTGLRQ